MKYEITTLAFYTLSDMQLILFYRIRSCENEIKVMNQFSETVPPDSNSVCIYPKPISFDIFDEWKSFSKPAQVV